MESDIAPRESHHHNVSEPVSFLYAMGYEEPYIERAINVHKKSQRGNDSDLSLLIDIISRLKVRDAAKSQVTVPFMAHYNVIADALALNEDDHVDFRYENGRYIICKVLEKRANEVNGHWVLLLHPLGEPLSIEKHNRFCTVNLELHRLAPPKSVSLRKLKVKSHLLSTLSIDDYVDINPLNGTGPDHRGWTHGRLIKMDGTSAQIKVAFYNDIEHRHEAQWVHIEDEREVAPFKSKVVPQRAPLQSTSSISNRSNVEVVDYPVFEVMSSLTTPRVPRYSSISTTDSRRPSRHSVFSLASNQSYDSVFSHHPVAHHLSHQVNPQVNPQEIHPMGHQPALYGHQCLQIHNDIVSQLVAFGYRMKDIRTAMDSVSNASDINEVMAYIATNSICKPKALDSPKVLKPVKVPPIMSMVRSISEIDQSDNALYGIHNEEEEEKEDSQHSGSRSSELYEGPIDPDPLNSSPINSMMTPSARHTVTFSIVSALSSNHSARTQSKSLSALRTDETNQMVLPSLPLSNPPSNQPDDDCGVFGVHPIKLPSMLFTEKDYGAPIPNILVQLKYELFMNEGHLVRGVFKEKADRDLLLEMVRAIDCGKMDDVLELELSGVLMANLIELWFERLPQKVLEDVECERIESCKSINVAGQIIENDIGEPNESYFKWLLDLCVDVTENEKQNRMSIKQIAAAIAPCLRSAGMENGAKFVQLAILWRHFSK